MRETGEDQAASASRIPTDSGKSSEELFAERSQRIRDAAALKKPDRAPMHLGPGYLLAEYGGISSQELHDDGAKYQEILERFACEFEPDSMFGLLTDAATGLALGDRMTAWPGHGLPVSGQFQFVENEFMKAEDYPAFLRDPSDWMVRTYLPRAFARLEGLRALPPLGVTALGVYNLESAALYAAPGVSEAFSALAEASKVAGERLQSMFASFGRMAALGFPPFFAAGALVAAPFDFMSDTLRGMRGIMLDILRNPKELLAAEEKVLEIQFEHILLQARATGMDWAVFPLHRGSDGFMSIDHFERFYWPQLKRLFLALIENVGAGAKLTP